MVFQEKQNSSDAELAEYLRGSRVLVEYLPLVD